jgi:tRNA-splicing ligase RtcB
MSVSKRVRGYRDLWSAFADLHPAVAGRLDRAMAQMGTLGSGNHFVELCLDTDDVVWLMLHSGSRNIGKELAEVHIRAARQLPHNTGLPDRELAVFLAGRRRWRPTGATWTGHRPTPGATGDDAGAVRRGAARLLPGNAVPAVPEQGPHAGERAFAELNCHHNYVAEEHHYGADVLVTRKGAISARAGEYGIIPGSMGTRSYLVRGMGNASRSSRPRTGLGGG